MAAANDMTTSEWLAVLTDSSGRVAASDQLE